LSGGQEPQRQAEVLLAQLQAVRDQLNQLQAYTAQMEQMLASLRASIQGAEAAEENAEVMAPLDPNMNAFIRARVASGRVAVGIGRGIYVALERDKALEVLRDREAKYVAVINRLKAEMERLAQAYAQLAQELERLQQQSIQRPSTQKGGEA